MVIYYLLMIIIQSNILRVKCGRNFEQYSYYEFNSMWTWGTYIL